MIVKFVDFDLCVNENGDLFEEVKRGVWKGKDGKTYRRVQRTFGNTLDNLTMGELEEVEGRLDGSFTRRSREPVVRRFILTVCMRHME